jgi:cyclophilin family peptidyl-prolyl cis-trans isomerase
MKKNIVLFILLFLTIFNNANTKENLMILELKYGKVEIELFNDVAPNHVKRFKTLANEGKYDGVVFHRVIDGFMAQSGDVKFGNSSSPDFNISLAGTGGSDLPNLKAEFSNTSHERGTLSAARSADPNSANSQFFICLDTAPHLDRQYSAFGKVTKGMEFIDMIKKGVSQSGTVDNPDKIISLRSKN